MFQKFILTRRGILRLGTVRMHRDLLTPDDSCIGGGFYEVDYLTSTLLLSRESYDFGAPRWNVLTGTLKVPHAYQGFRIVYQAADDPTDSIDLTDRFEIEYI
jgi:hypothetical protein